MASIVNLQWSYGTPEGPAMDPMLRLDADMRRKGQEPSNPEPHAEPSQIQAAAPRLFVGKSIHLSSG